VTEHTLAVTDYGGAITAVVRRANFWGTQFHPERSSTTGERILQNFLRL
jgi:glutamine amidotransferase